MATESEQNQRQEEAIRYKTLAETKFKKSNIKSALKHIKKAHRVFPNLEGLSSMLTAFTILRLAGESDSGTAPDWYKILQVEPFSHINTIKARYKKLALTLHPDKNPYSGCEDAFKLATEGFQIFSDRIKKSEYDMKLRIRIQDEKVDMIVEDDTFWTSCTRCRLLHQFHRKYLGHNLVCPSCKKGFKADEVDSGAGGVTGEESMVPIRSERLKRKRASVDNSKGLCVNEKSASVVSRKKVGGQIDRGNEADGGSEEETSGGDSGNVDGHRVGARAKKKSREVGDILDRSKEMEMEKEKYEEEMMTLAEMQLEIKRKVNQKKANLKGKEKEKGEEQKEMDSMAIQSRDSIVEGHGSTSKARSSTIERQGVLKKKGHPEVPNPRASKKIVDLEVGTRGAMKMCKNSDIVKRRASGKNIERSHSPESENSENMEVEDSDLYDFDKDRVERSFKKGQVWSIYNDDGMPRFYGLIDEIVSLNPFEVKISWLDHLNSGEEIINFGDKMGAHVSCGRFKVGKKTLVNSLKTFSHVVECERVAREVYRIYPKKGSVWALYNEAASSAEGRSEMAKNKGYYDIVVFLTTYSEIYRLSLGYLEKVDGFKTVFKRREIGSHAIRYLEKVDMCFLSHQIPAKKLVGDKVPEILKECWELDPASLPSYTLTVDSVR